MFCGTFNVHLKMTFIMYVSSFLFSSIDFSNFTICKTTCFSWKYKVLWGIFPQYNVYQLVVFRPIFIMASPSSCMLWFFMLTISVVDVVVVFVVHVQIILLYWMIWDIQQKNGICFLYVFIILVFAEIVCNTLMHSKCFFLPS